AWSESTADTNPADRAAHLAQLGIGLLPVIVAAEHLWAPMPRSLPTLAVYGSSKHHRRHQRRTEDFRQDGAGGLAKTQQIAHLRG
ncbi:MAG: hypothetical protein AVDCRST_MAG73-2155, partial [uncultured Thermomicrobiales bacterium]